MEVNVLIQIDEPPKKSFALFYLGFRVFFLFAALSAIVLMAIWGLSYANLITLNSYYGVIHWHSHEMLFGYSIAVIAGFLLTAVRNWTNVDTITKMPLALLSAIWIIARILPFTSTFGMVIALFDVAFFVLLTVAVAHPIIKAKQWHNLIMVLILSLFTLADILVQSQHLGFLDTGIVMGNLLALYSILLVVQVLTGRVMPFFTRVIVPNTDVAERPLLEKILLMSLLLLTAADVLALNGIMITLLAAILLIAHIVRVLPWFSKPVLNVPILWVLYAGYLWLLIGFVMKILVGLDIVASHLAIHAWTVGVIGITTYGMMARVSLGHTGREMKPKKLVIWGFYLLFLAAFIRVILPLFTMAYYTLWIQLSAVLWIVAFVFFAMVYTPMLMQPRVDGRAG
jgi:uncharacterized protein involved in response to NO